MSMFMRTLRLVVLAVALASASCAAHAQGKSAPKDALLYFIWPQNGAVIEGAFWCRFGLRNMGVTHAGDDYPNSGHHHLFIDVNEPLDVNEPIPQDKNHLHFGAGQTEARLELPPGKHTLQLVLGDAKHYPFNPPLVSEKITITVRGSPATAGSVAHLESGRAGHRHFEGRWPSAEPQTVPPSVNVGHDVPRDDAVAANPRQSVASNARVAEKHAKLRTAHAEQHDPVCGAKGRRFYGDHHYWYWRCRR